MDKFEELGRRLDEELTRLRKYVEEEVAPVTEKRTAQFLREVSEKLAEASKKLEDRVAARKTRIHNNRNRDPTPATTPRCPYRAWIFRYWLRGPAQMYKNISIFKTFNIREKVRLELRGLLNNFTNSPVFGDPATNMSTPTTFGVITTAGGTRTVNFMAKVRF